MFTHRVVFCIRMGESATFTRIVVGQFLSRLCPQEGRYEDTFITPAISAADTNKRRPSN